MSETEEYEEAAVSAIIEGIDSFSPVHHDGTPIQGENFGSRGRKAGAGIYRHPPLACPAPRQPGTLRGFYRCPACGVRVTLAGQIRASELGQELGERWAEAIAGGVGQAFWYTVDLAVAIGKGLHWVWKWLRNRRVKAAKNGGVAPEMVHALVVIGMVAARYRPVSDEKGAELCPKLTRPCANGVGHAARLRSPGGASSPRTCAVRGAARLGDRLVVS